MHDCNKQIIEKNMKIYWEKHEIYQRLQGHSPRKTENICTDINDTGAVWARISAAITYHKTYHFRDAKDYYFDVRLSWLLRLRLQTSVNTRTTSTFYHFAMLSRLLRRRTTVVVAIAPAFATNDGHSLCKRHTHGHFLRLVGFWLFFLNRMPHFLRHVSLCVCARRGREGKGHKAL